MSTVIKACNLTKKFGQTVALSEASLNINRGEVLAIMGPSGSGKSTLLHALAGIITPDSGDVFFDTSSSSAGINNQARNSVHVNIKYLSDKERSTLRRTEFGFVFQFGQLVPELDVATNVALPLLFNGIKKGDAYLVAKTWLERVGLSNKFKSLPGELSGGEAQRTALARAMAIEPQVLFADEPTGALDSLTSQQVMELMVSTARNANTTIVMVTHEPTVAAYADREVIVRDGKVIDIFATPDNFATTAHSSTSHERGEK